MEKSFFEREEEGRKLLEEICWLGAPGTEGPVFRGRLHYRTEDGPIYLYYTACGFLSVFLNGSAVGDEMFVPAWSDYHSRGFFPGEYSHYFLRKEISGALHPGENGIEVRLGNGWYNQNIRTCEGEMSYGVPKIKVLAARADGRVLFRSDRDLRAFRGPMVFNQIYIGERYDANLLTEEPVSTKAVIYENFDSVPRLQEIPCDKLCGENTLFPISPKAIGADPSGGRITYDAGCNMTGRVSIVTSAPRGARIRICYAETTDGEQNLTYSTTAGVDRLQEDEYISNGLPSQRYGAEFVLHGFRYFTIEGEIDSFSCDLILPDVRTRKFFRTEDPLLQQIVTLYQRAQLTNLHWGVPSDCPHRERLGYTGDGQLTAGTAMYFWELESFYLKWMRDLADSQDRLTGHVPHTAPFAGGGGGPGIWGGAMVFLPWKLHREYGNRHVFQTYYSYMMKWMRYLETRSETGLLDHEEPTGWCLGDWCAPGGSKLDPTFVNSCCYLLQLSLMEQIAEVTGHSADAAGFSERRRVVSRAVCEAYRKDERFFNGVEGAEAYAYAAGLLQEEEARRLLSLYRNKKLDTGIGGTPVLFWALRRLKLDDIVRQLLSDTEYPSFGFMVRSGATTLWETFEGKDSLNHPMFGAFVYFLLPEF